MMEKYLHLFRDILKNNNSIYLIISILILFIIGKKSNITFFDFSDIIKKYTSCFRKSKITICIVFVLPIILAYIAVRENKIDDSTINIITIIISILTAMFFTLIQVIIDLREKYKCKEDIDATKSKHIKALINETFYLLIYEIMNSIFILLFCFMTIFSKKYGELDSYIIYYFSVTLILNLFIVLSRMFDLIHNILE